ncbi:MAG: Nramp family divalent metal transporter, partial [Pirellulaceae bacterium]
MTDSDSITSDERAKPAQRAEAPHPGSQSMPRWDLGRLPKPPRFTWRSLPLLLGPGLVCGSAAIGGGEWLTGPLVTARYGGVMLWLATLSILGQTLYNIEISRYTLYSGEPIFTGKFRVPPGPMFWLPLYLVLDFGSLLPYLASTAAVPLFAMLFRRLPNPQQDEFMLKGLACCLFLALLLPLLVGGRVYRSLKWLMTFKLVFVMGFLLLLAVMFSTPATWYEVFTGFFRFGTLPVQPAETAKEASLWMTIQGGVSAVGTPPRTVNVFSLWLSGESLPPIDFSMLGILAALAAISGNGGLSNTPISNYTRDQGWGMGHH